MTKPTKWHVRPALETPKTGFYVRGLNRFRQIEPPHDKTNKMACVPSVGNPEDRFSRERLK